MRTTERPGGRESMHKRRPSSGDVGRPHKGLVVLLVAAGTATAVWMAVEKVFVDRWEREERANLAAREAQGASHRSGRPERVGPTGRRTSERDRRSLESRGSGIPRPYLRASDRIRRSLLRDARPGAPASAAADVLGDRGQQRPFTHARSARDGLCRDRSRARPPLPGPFGQPDLRRDQRRVLCRGTTCPPSSGEHRSTSRSSTVCICSSMRCGTS